MHREAMPRMLAPMVAMLLASLAFVTRPAKKAARFVGGQARRFQMENSAVLNIGPLLGIVVVIISAVVAMALVAALAPSYMGSLANVTGVFTDPATTTGNADADALLPVFGLLVAFGGLFAIVALVFIAIRLRRS